jgi:LysR family transcriptional regulator, low CO2-responsive transcriptional regulator
LSFYSTQLRAFLAVVEHGSLRAAADVLCVSPAAISSSLTSLSRAVGVPLLSREGRGVKLTLAGVSFATDAKRLMALSLGSVASARAAMRRIELPLRIGAVAAANEAFLGELLAEFMTKEPEIEVELEVVRREALWPLLEERELDLGFAEVPPHRPTLHLLAARANDYVVAARSSRRYDKRALDNSLWLVREAGSGTRSATEDFLAEHGLAPSKRTLGSASAIVRCVVAGVGVSLLPRDMIANELRTGRIQIVRTPFTPRPRPWFMIASADRALSVTMQRFVNLAIKSQAFAALN